MAETLRAFDIEDGQQPDPAARWYACYTRARHEKRVAEVLMDRGVETFLPLVPRKSQWKDRTKIVDWALFPSYVFARFALTQVHRVLSVPSVVTLVKASGRPVAIADAEIENVRMFARALREGEVEVELTPFFAEGELVEVTGGPFIGVKGVVVEQRGRRRVVIGLSEIGQGMEVHIEPGLLQPVSSAVRESTAYQQKEQ